MNMHNPLEKLLLIMLLGLGTQALSAQSTDAFDGTWVSAAQGFRLIIYRQQNQRQILFYGKLQTMSGDNRYVSRADNIRSSAQGLQFELPALSVYSNSSSDIAVAGHKSELPANNHDTHPSKWQVVFADGLLKLDCASPKREDCGLRTTVELYLESSQQ